MGGADDEKPDLGSLSRSLEEFVLNTRRLLAAVDQMGAKCDAVIEKVRRERVREKWRNLATCAASALAGCLIGALVFGR